MLVLLHSVRHKSSEVPFSLSATTGRKLLPAGRRAMRQMCETLRSAKEINYTGRIHGKARRLLVMLPLPTDWEACCASRRL